MQRVARELLEALDHRDDIQLNRIVLESSWRWVHVRVFPFLGRTYLRLRRLIESDGVDIILFSSMVTALLTIVLRRHLRAHGVRTAVIVHGLDVTTPLPLYQDLVRKVFSLVDRVLPVSGATGEQCLERGLEPEKLRVVHNGVNPDRFSATPASLPERVGLLQLLERRSIDPGPGWDVGERTVLSSVGRLVARKGYAWFVEHVMPLLPGHIEYWIGGDGPERQAIDTAVANSPCGDRIRILGTLGDKELDLLYRGSDLFIMPNIPVPNDMEGFGIVMLEAGMNGLPSVGSKLEGIAEVIYEGQNGHFAEPLNAEQFAHVIQRYLRENPDPQAARERAYEYTNSTFAWDSIAAETVEVLRETVSQV